jgi:polysaccharide export outer membrane protein
MYRLFVTLVVAIALRVPTPCGAQSRPAATNVSDSADFLRPGDVIRLKIWREPDLSGEIPVKDDGDAVFPKLGSIQVTHLLPDSLEHFLVKSYTRYLRDPSIDVTVLRRVSVSGAVSKPGVYSVDPTMTVADAVALAGGATSDGKADKVELRRSGHRIMVDLSRQTRLATMPIRAGDQLYVPERSWVSRNTGLVAAGITAATTVIVTLLVR